MHEKMVRPFLNLRRSQWGPIEPGPRAVALAQATKKNGKVVAPHMKPTQPLAEPVARLAQSVLEASQRIHGVVKRTRVVDLSSLFPESGARVFAKLENEQETGSFKLRGASNKILSLSAEERRAGVTTASNGNHGLGLALAAQKTDTPTEVFVSDQVAPERIDRIATFRVKVTRAGKQPLDAEIAARSEAARTGRIFVSPYNDYQVVSGQGTAAVELLDQLPSVDAVFITVGCGGLLGGMGAYLKQAAPQTEVVACWPKNSRVLYECLNAGKIIEFEEQTTLSDSSAGGVEEGSITFAIAQSVIDSRVLVTEEEILETIRLVKREKSWWIEGAAAVALAAFAKTSKQYAGKTVAVVLCGGNVSEWVRQLV
jgi:threonine dehydratase